MYNVSNPCNHSYKNRGFLPGGNITSPSLMFLSLKLDIEGHEPTIMHNAPSWSYNLLLCQSNKHNWECRRIVTVDAMGMAKEGERSEVDVDGTGKEIGDKHMETSR